MITTPSISDADRRYNSAYEKLKPKLGISQMNLKGQGGYGRVFEVIIDNKRYAIKVIDYHELLDKAKNKIEKEINQKMINNECTYLLNLNHKNLLKAITRINFPEEKLIMILMIYCENYDLQFIRRLLCSGKLFMNIKTEESNQILNNNIDEKGTNKILDNCLKFPTQTFVRFFAQQILNGLKYLHECGLVHCDLKLKNILVTRDFTVKIADFGTMKSKKDYKNIPNVSTKTYQSAEFFLGIKDSIVEENVHKLDLYSFGVIIYTFFFNNHYMESKDLEENKNLNYFNKIYTEKIVNNKVLEKYKDLHDLLKGLLQPDIDKRFDISQTLSHSWFYNEGRNNFKFFTEIYDNDNIKFLLELQKIEFSPYLKDFLKKDVFSVYEQNEEKDYEEVPFTD